MKLDLNVTDKPDLIKMSLPLFGGPGQTAPVAPLPSPLSAAQHISGIITTIPRLFSEHSLKNENKNQVFHIPGVVLRQVSDGFGYTLLQRKLHSYLNAVSLPNCGLQRCRNFIGQVHLPMNQIRTPGVPIEFSWVEDDDCMSEKVGSYSN